MAVDGILLSVTMLKNNSVPEERLVIITKRSSGMAKARRE